MKRLSYLPVGATGLKAGVNGSAALVVIANALVIYFAKQIFIAMITSFNASRQGPIITGLQAGGQRAKTVAVSTASAQSYVAAGPLSAAISV